ncbi:MAG: hypothetical protein HYV19_04345 [Gemmatimonadetes bacterium]|nr:hypothetical protein [Gemmatimonadota bacterium]
METHLARAITLMDTTDRLRCPEGHELERAPANAARPTVLRCWECGSHVLHMADAGDLGCFVSITATEAAEVTRRAMAPAAAARFLGLAWPRAPRHEWLAGPPARRR